ncbi:outer membrane beta-barrel protein [Amphritea sp. 1_MG-2023]|uniref:outer membrane beta-barrel protein n=1 Tax=Amphritea sp. 1_MG-2023 TaxID=3062670 RepID=UPI0026E1FEA6|nr:outer membrane beta-barrel protein [Amphritea sp. 1_MG-2023]MDO6562857.1 outer membrane beta-barrel protein [Amphritea sp. 1_MG-2023]
MKKRTLVSLIAPSALIFTLPASATIEPAAIDAGPVKIIPMITAQVGYDDNFFSTADNEEDETITVLSPSVQVVAEDGLNAYRVVYQLSDGTHQNNTADNYTDHTLSADAHIEFSQRSVLDLKAAYNKGHEARGSNDYVTSSPIEYDVTTASFRYMYGAPQATGRIEFYGEHLEREFTNFRTITTGRDDTEVTLGSVFYYKVMPKTSLLFEVRNKDIDYDVDPSSSLDNNTWKYLVGATWEGTAKTTGTVKVGVSDKDFESASREDFTSASWEASVRWAPRTYSVVDISTSRSAAESSGTGDFIDTKNYNINWNHAWNDVINSDLGLGMTSETYEGDVNGREDDTTSINVGMNYDMRRWLTFGLSYTFSDVDSNIATEDYTKNLVMLTVNAAL